MSVDYCESVLRAMGSGTPSFFRLFMIPGMFHCGGGIGCGSFDKLTPLMQWVEQNVAPDRLIGAKVVDGKTVRTRPLCPYPQTATYIGSGRNLSSFLGQLSGGWRAKSFNVSLICEIVYTAVRAGASP
jgi:hypothetical protein